LNSRVRNRADTFSRSLLVWLAALLWLVGQVFVLAQPAAPWTRVPNSTLQLPAEAPIEGFGLVNAFGELRFHKPVAVVAAPGETNRVFVVEKTGRIWAVSNAPAPGKSLFLDLSDRVIHSTEAGLLGLAFHPGFATNGHFFVFRTALTNVDGGLAGLFDVLSRFTVTPTNPAVALPESELVILAQADDSDTHNAGDLHFGPDGYLYLSVGDETPTLEDASENKQPLDKGLFGGILRIDVDQRPGNLPPNPHRGVTPHYSIPADNPFIGITNYQGIAVNPAEVRTEFYALGLRNPWRMAFHPTTGELWVGEVGGGFVEEINRVTRGANYGWPYLENAYPGPHDGRQPPAFDSLPPVYHYPHGYGTNEGRCVIGGLFYQGTNLPGLDGHYVFGDFYTGHVWAMQLDGTNASQFRLLTSRPGLSAFGRAPHNGDVLVANHNEGVVYRLVYRAPGEMTPLPPTLADTGVFTNLLTLEPHAGIVPYEINVPFWSDHALKRRWFSLPDPALHLGFNPTSTWAFPTGAVWVKHFELELTNGVPASRRRLETRLLVRSGESVYGATYRWDETQTNATLVPDIGLDEDISVVRDGEAQVQRWRYPSRSECLVCHNPTGGRVLGFNTEQLNRAVDYGAGPTNQLLALAAAGYFSNAVPDPSGLVALAHATNTAAPLAHRARSFLTANCASCHHPGSTAEVFWDARITTPLAQAAILDAPLVYHANARFLNSTNPTASIALLRLAALDLTRMPIIGSTVVNTNAIALLTRWLSTLPPAPWTPRNLGPAVHEGASSLEDNRWNIGGVGAGFTPAGDAYHQLTRAFTGSVRFSARLRATSGTHPDAFAGLILRGGSGSAAPFAAVGVNGAGVLTTAARPATNGALSAATQGTSVPEPWLALAREGETVTAWQSADGITWSAVATNTLPDAAPGEIGFAAASGTPGDWNVAEFEQLRLAGVRLDTPAAGQSFPAFAPVPLSAAVTNEGVAIQRVEFLANEQLVAQVFTPPFSAVWTNAPPGVHALRAVLVDENGAAVSSPPVNIEVAPAGTVIVPLGTEDGTQGNWTGTYGTSGYVLAAVATNLPPGVTLKVTNDADMVWAAETTDTRALLQPGGTNRVAAAWLSSNNLVVELNLPEGMPYSVALYFLDWDTPGTRVQDIEVSDAGSGVVHSTTRLEHFESGRYLRYALHGHVRIRISPVNGTTVLSGIFLDPLNNQPPQAHILQPPSGTVSAPASFNVEVAATDDQGVARVELFLDGQWVDARTNAPWTFALPLLPAGTRTLRARAWDVWNQSADSPPVTLTLTAPPAAALFEGEDTLTQGDWPGQYGQAGHLIVAHSTNLPPFALLTPLSANPFIWVDWVTNRPALRHVSDNWRIASCWFDSPEIVLDLDLADGRTHRVAAYFMEWGPDSREQRVEVRDASSGALLDERTVSLFASGKYLRWQVRGRVRLHIVQQLGGNAVISGIFLDAAPPPFETWRLSRFSAAQLADPLVSGPDADPDGDGLMNSLEFAMESSPLSFDLPPEPGLQDGHLTLTYRRSKAVDAAAFWGEYSTNLVEWLSGPAHVEEIQRTDGGELETVTLRSVAPMSARPEGYLRLRVQP
jgi:glucose/arabinose dehydrogenase/mono/diheme cytochrome c family protein